MIAIIAAVSLWPAFVNGGPFFMQDTPSYLRATASGFYKFLGVKSEWANEYLRLYAAHAGAPSSSASTTGTDLARQIPVTLSGRSIYYGALLFLSDLAGSLWLALAVQSALAAAATFFTVNAVVRALGQTPSYQALLIGTAAAVLTPIGFFASYLMPDIFGALAVLSTANLLFLRACSSRFVVAFMTALLAYSLFVHSANLLIVVGMTGIAAIYAAVQRSSLPRTSVVMIGSCVVAAVLAQFFFAQMVRVSTGAAPVRPPFLAMRLIADGPGYDYLRSQCSTEHFIYCRTLASEPKPSDTLLWSSNPAVSLFRGLAPDEQRISAQQQSRFARQVIQSEPVAVLRHSARNSVSQFMDFRLSGFNYSPGMIERFYDSVPPRALNSIVQTRAFRRAMPTSVSEGLAPLTTAVAVLFMIIAMLLPRTRRRLGPVRDLFVIVLAGVAINAIVCGAVSGPKGRYQMRLIWILPVLSGAAALGLANTGSRPRRVNVRGSLDIEERKMPAG